MNAGKARVFISYSHRGNGPKWKAALLHGLHVFEQHRLLDVWQDGKIRVSSFWDDDIKQAMSNARLAVVLLTKEALESRYIIETEFPFLRERQQQDKLPVFPVICEECDWRSHDWLRATQSPNESNPISVLSEAAQERVFRRLATDIAEELSRVALAELPKAERPLARDHIYLDRFPLTQGSSPREEKLIGREQELALLDLAFAQPHTAIVSLVAWGGVGKTMLVQHWLQRLGREGWFGGRRVYAWSFYSQGTKEDRQASEDTFLAHALEWFEVECEPTLSPWDKGRLLAEAVSRERTLLILDGIEPLQYPPGPMGGQLRAPGVQSLLKQLARKANPKQSAIRNAKSEIGDGLCLVTTREPLTGLGDFERRPDAAWGSVLRVDLGNLTEEAGAALLHHAGAKRAGAAEINADDTELLAASGEVDGHALTLNLLGRFLARAHGGDIRRRDLGKFEEADLKEQGGTTFKMLAAFENWFAKSGEFGARQLAVLRMLGLFDRPAEACCIAALRKPPVIAGLTDPLFTTRLDANTGQPAAQSLLEEDWNTATSFLADFSLIVIPADAANREHLIDCHPLIREHFAKRLRKRSHEAWRFAHRRLYEHLKEDTEYRPNTLEGLQPLFQAVFHGCQAELQQQALVEILSWRIHRIEAKYVWRKLGAVGTELAALSCFFRELWSTPAEGFPDYEQGWILNETGFCLRALGRLTEALDPLRAGSNVAVRISDWPNAGQAVSNLSELELTLGDLPNALRDAKRSVRFADRSGDGFSKVAFRTGLADTFHQIGRIAKAMARFREAEAIQVRLQPDYPVLYSTQGFQYCDLLLAAAECAAWRAFAAKRNRDSASAWRGKFFAPYSTSCREAKRRAAMTLEWAAHDVNGSLLDVALDHLTLSRAAFYDVILGWDYTPGCPEPPQSNDSVWEPAKRDLQTAVDGLRRSAQQWFIPAGLLTRAWLHFLEGDADGARADLDESWDIAERGPMRLHLADIHLHRARLFFREKTYPWKSPLDDLAAAERLINECGYHRRDEELADAKRAILGPLPPR